MSRRLQHERAEHRAWRLGHTDHMIYHQQWVDTYDRWLDDLEKEDRKRAPSRVQGGSEDD